jgi:hypothetical protein
MGLNVKIWHPSIFGIYEIIFLKKILWKVHGFTA